MIPPASFCRIRHRNIIQRRRKASIPWLLPLLLRLLMIALLLLLVATTTLPNTVVVQASAVAAPPASAASAPATANTATATATEQTAGGGGSGSHQQQQHNMVVSLAIYMKDSVVRTVQGCGQLWTNHGKCNDIRKKQSKYRSAVQQQWEADGLYEDETNKQTQKRLQKLQGGISYEEYRFLQCGREDRGKLLNLVFLIWGAPKFLPYALMFNPDMLPSPFHVEKPGVAEGFGRERANAILHTLMKMEQQAAVRSGGFLSGIFSGGNEKHQQRQQLLETIVTETGDFFCQNNLPELPATPTASKLLEHVAPHLYRTETDFTRAEQRLVQVPACIVQGLNRAIAGVGFPGLLAQLTPAVLQRGKLVGHIQKVTADDDFLVQADIDLNTVPKRLLQEACRERMMNPQRSTDDLRASLAEWLQLTVEQPAAAVKLLEQVDRSSSSSSSSSSTEVDDSATTTTAVYFNGNLARMVLMAYYGCATVRDAQCDSRLPRLLFTGKSGVTATAAGGSSSSNKRVTPSPSQGKKGWILLKKQ